ncbi:hypothetical protein K0M31_005895 [Melipona bicolor]|uniref:Uncharacterized protein n=1 Tax=Melipona bicolor TaxID=60889 RepID=A0AA40KMG2_9HYME|nr:hypothetical protein K0M31_005895 [Melipona bicolor]
MLFTNSEKRSKLLSFRAFNKEILVEESFWQQNILLSKLSHRDSFESRFIEAIDVARPRDMTRNHVVSTEYSDKFLPPQIYRVPDDGAARTEIAEMETVL